METLTRFFVQLAYFFDTSLRYKKAKEFCRSFLEYSHSKLKFYFDIFMVLLVVVSVFLLLYEVKNPDGHPYLEFIVQFSLVVFIIEYLLRFWIASDSHALFLERYEYALNNNLPFSLWRALGLVIKKKIEYIISPLAIIDLLAILPSYRPLRFLRIFLLFRILKLFRYAKSMKTFTTIITEKKFELLTLAIFASFVIFTGSSAIYIFETHQNPKINTMLDAVYWAVVTMGTVGYGDIVPVTSEGMIVSMILIVLGVATLAFLTSIIVSSFQTKLIELKESRVLSDIERFESYVVICGYGRVGEVVAKMLHEDGYHLVILDNDEEKIKLAQQRGFIGIVADASKSRILGEIGVGKRASHIICATNSDELNVFITLTARSLSKHIIIIARVIKNSHKKKYLLAGATYAFSADETIGLMGAQFISQPISYTALDEMLTENTGVVFDTLIIHEHSYFVHHTIESLQLEEKRLLLFGILRKKENQTAEDITPFLFNPPKDFLIRPYDTLIFMGRRHHINVLRKQNDLRKPL